MSAVDTTDWIVCTRCSAPHPPVGGCTNPACDENPRLSGEHRQAIVARREAYYAQQAADEERRRLRAMSFGVPS